LATESFSGLEGGGTALEEIVARAEALGKRAREMAEISARQSREAIARAEK